MPTINDALISDRFDVSPSPSTREDMSEHEDVPECPPPSDDEFEGSPDDSSVAGMSVAASVASDACSLLPQEDVQELINQSLSQGGA